jgi:predicted small integral membrane protein
MIIERERSARDRERTTRGDKLRVSMLLAAMLAMVLVVAVREAVANDA